MTSVLGAVEPLSSHRRPDGSTGSPIQPPDQLLHLTRELRDRIWETVQALQSATESILRMNEALEELQGLPPSLVDEVAGIQGFVEQLLQTYTRLLAPLVPEEERVRGIV